MQQSAFFGWQLEVVQVVVCEASPPRFFWVDREGQEDPLPYPA